MLSEGLVKSQPEYIFGLAAQPHRDFASQARNGTVVRVTCVQGVKRWPNLPVSALKKRQGRCVIRVVWHCTLCDVT